MERKGDFFVRTHITIFVMIILSFLTLHACQRPSLMDGESLEFKASDQKEIVIWHTYSELETEIFEREIIPLYEERSPNIVITAERKAYTDQLKKSLISKASAGKPPDIVRMDLIWIPFFAHYDFLYPLSDFPEFIDIQQNLHSAPLEASLYEHYYYGLPINMNTKAAIYNKKELEKLTIDQPPSTMNDLIDLIKDQDLQIIMPGLSMWDILPYFYAFGGEFINTDTKHAQGALDSEESVNAFKQMLHLFESEILIPKPFSFYTDTWRDVVEGDIFMIDEGPWYFSTRTETDLLNVQHKTVVAPFPGSYLTSSVLGGESLVIMKNTPHLEESWDFIQWMATEKPQKRMLRAGLIPANKNVQINIDNSRNAYIESYLKGLETAFFRPAIVHFEKVDHIFMDYVEMIYEGKLDVSEAFTEAAIEIDEILTEVYNEKRSPTD